MTQAQQTEAQRAVELQVDEVIELACEWRSSWLNSHQSSEERGRLFEKFTSHLRALLSGKCLHQIAEPAAYPEINQALFNGSGDLWELLYAWSDGDCDAAARNIEDHIQSMMRTYVDADRAQRAAAPQAGLKESTAMTSTTAITHAALLLRSAAHELQQSHTTSRDRDDWTGEEEAKAAYDEHIAAADALEAAVQRLPSAPAHPAEGVPAAAVQALRTIAEYPATDLMMNMDAANMRLIAEEALAATQPAAQGLDALTQAASSVLAERARQIAAEGWAPEADDQYNTGVLSLHGGLYACHAYDNLTKNRAPEGWQWDEKWWKSKDPRSNLVKAGALILAEIERIDRTYAAQQPKEQTCEKQ